VAERLGTGGDALLARNPRLVLVPVSGFGQTGPYARRPGFGTLVEAMSGFASRNGFEDREPVLPPLAMADMIAGLYGAMATVIAVRQRAGGPGALIDLSYRFDLFDPRAGAAIHKLTQRVRWGSASSRPRRATCTQRRTAAGSPSRRRPRR
jgi:crotonobetainyl-CoA:carnitine CoA-transferase CaiB-like acyl-CoA transferase